MRSWKTRKRERENNNFKKTPTVLSSEIFYRVEQESCGTHTHTHVYMFIKGKEGQQHFYFFFVFRILFQEKFVFGCGGFSLI